MSFRTALVAVAVSALLTVSTADTNGTTPTSAPTSATDTNGTTSAPTSAPSTTGSTSTTVAIPAGVNCIPVADNSGFNVGDIIQLGADTTQSFYITAIFAAAGCPTSARRLAKESRQLGGGQSISVTPKTTTNYPAGTAVTVKTSNPAPAPTPPGETTILTNIPVGTTCVPLYDVQGFAKGNTIQIGTAPYEWRYVMELFELTLCGQTLTTRRLNTDIAGSVKLEAGTTFEHAKGTEVKVITPPAPGPTCFPGDATVDVYGRGTTQMASLSVGDRVRVQSGDFEPVLSFLHKVPGAAQALTVVHAQGTFRASENHIVFTSQGDVPVSALRPGDELLVQTGPSPILALGQESTTAGMYAPFTSSGALIVDGVVASSYGTPSSGMNLPHAAAHAAFFALRVYHYLDLGVLPKLLEYSRGSSKLLAKFIMLAK